MNDPFNLLVSYKGTEMEFPAQLLQLGYLHKFQVDINGQMVLFEPDEERNYRAFVAPEDLDKMKVDKELLKAIAEALSSL
jgi:hypothetical protein